LNGEDFTDLLETRLMIELAAVERGITLIEPGQLEEMWRLTNEMATAAAEEGEGDEFDYLAFAERDSQFHLLIVASAMNRRLTDIYRRLSLHMHLARLSYAAQIGRPRRMMTVQEHEAIVEAFEARNLPVLKAALTNHIQRVTRSFAAAGVPTRTGVPLSPGG
jgi:DNA-binding GntR family transcriptional regulator